MSLSVIFTVSLNVRFEHKHEPKRELKLGLTRAL